MSVASKPLSPFGRKVRGILDGRGQSIRSLARSMNPDNPEDAKRDLLRWFKADGPVPGPRSRRRVETGLGVEAGTLDDDDEESDPVAALMDALRAVVRAEVKSAA